MVSAASLDPARGSVYTMKVVVDLTICDLHGLCVDAAPEVFQIGDDGNLHVLDEAPPETLREKVQKAARECPTGAITIEG
jgi:ferredoxin